MLRIAKHFCLLFFLLFGVAAKAQVKISASIDSPSIMMGQQTVVHFHVSQPQHLAVQLPVLSDILAPGVYIVSVSGDTIADGSTISINDNIVITVFEPGDYVIPPFVCREQNKEYKTRELKLKVSDVPDVFVEGKLPADIKEINTPPYSTTLWVVLIVSVVLMVLMGIWTYYYWRKHREDPEPYVKNSAVADSAQPEKTALELIRNLAAEKCWLQGVLLSAVTGLPHRWWHLAQELAAQDLLELPQQPVVAGEEPAQATRASHHPLPHPLGLGGGTEVPLRGLWQGLLHGLQGALGFLQKAEIPARIPQGQRTQDGELYL